MASEQHADEGVEETSLQDVTTETSLTTEKLEQTASDQCASKDRIEQLIQRQRRLQLKVSGEINQTLLDQFASQTSHQQLLNKAVNQVEQDHGELQQKMDSLMQEATRLQSQLSVLPSKVVEVKQLLQLIETLEVRYGVGQRK